MTCDAFKNPIFVALDVDTADRALSLAKNLSSHVGGFKIGPRLVVRYGGQLISELAKWGKVFVDNKYWDIPSTMESAVQATFEMGAGLTSVHALSGQEALERLSHLEERLNKKKPFRILAITVLTSFNEHNRPGPLSGTPIQEQVNTLVKEASAAGINGFVCSPQEVREIRQMRPDGLLLTPGIRLGGDSLEDQNRVASPLAALRAGASLLVVGRPICEAIDPVEAAERYLASVKEAER